MAFTEALRLLITADTQGAVHGIQQVGRTAERELSRADKSLDRWGTRLTTVGAGLLSFGAVAAYGLNQAAKSAVDLGEAVNASNVVFGKGSDTIDKYAKTSATSMGLSERAFRQALVPVGAMLKNVGLSEEDAADQSVKLAQRAADMASVFNTDVSTALEAIQAGLRGEADPLERFGVGLNEAAVNAKAVELGLAASTSEVDASAKAQARLALIFEQSNSFAGDFANTSDSLANRQRTLSAEFENLKAAIGEGAIPVMETLFDVASTGVGAFSGLNDATGGAVGTIATIGTVASLGVGGLSLLAGQIIKTRTHLIDAGQAVSNFVGAGGLGKLAGVLAKGGVIIGGLLLLEEVLDAVLGDQASIAGANLGRLSADMVKLGETGKITGELLDVVGEDFKDLKDAFKDVDVSGVEGARASVDRFAASIPGVGRALDTGFAHNIDEAKQKLDDFDKALADIASQDPGLAFDILGQAADALGVEVDDLIPALDDYDTAVGNAAASAALAGGDVDEFGRSMGETAGATEDATTALEAYADALAAQFDPLFGMQDALHGAEEAQRAVAEAQTALNEALAAGDPTAIAEAQRGYDDALRGAEGALFDVQQAQITLNGAIERGDVTVAQAQQQLYDWAIAAGYTHEQAMIMAGGLGSAADAAAWLGAQDPTVTVATQGVPQANADLVGLKSKLDAIPREVNVVTRVTTILSGSTNIPLRAGGGDVEAGRAYIVGEHRPELFVPDQAGTIWPSVPPRAVPAPAGAGGGGGGGLAPIYLNVYVNSPFGSPPEIGTKVVESIKAFERNNGAGWRG